MRDKSITTLPVVLALGYVIVLTLFGSGWTWQLYDELGWLDLQTRFLTVTEFVKHDIADNGRYRPLHSFVVYRLYEWTQNDPHVLRIIRVCQFALCSGLLLYYLRAVRKLPWIIAAFGLAFWLKSPPQLEQIRWMTLIELYGTIFLLLALIVHSKSRVASYALIVLAALGKEPFILFLPLPALLERKRLEASLTTAVAFTALLVLALNRHGYSQTVTTGISPVAINEIVRGLVLDFAPLLLLIPFIRVREFDKPDAWRALVFAAFGAAYFVIIGRAAWGYTYILSPVILMASLAVAMLLSAVHILKKGRAVVLLLSLLTVLFSARVAWNWTKVYARTNDRAGLFAAAASADVQGGVATNCPVDGRGVGLASNGRPDITDCTPAASLAECCKNAGLLAITRECGDFDTRATQAHERKLRELYSNKNWLLFSCKASQ